MTAIRASKVTLIEVLHISKILSVIAIVIIILGSIPNIDKINASINNDADGTPAIPIAIVRDIIAMRKYCKMISSRES